MYRLRGLKETCQEAIKINPKNPIIELRYPRVYANVIATQIGSVTGLKIREYGLYDIYEFKARELLEYLVGIPDEEVAE